MRYWTVKDSRWQAPVRSIQVVIIKSEEINMVGGHNIESAEKCLQIDPCVGMVENCLCIATQILTHRCFRSFSLLLSSPLWSLSFCWF